MNDCCASPGNDETFTPRTARRTARRYRRRGLLRRERDIVEPVAAQGITGATVFEVGGGVGQLQLALLDRGAAHATNLELSPHYEDEALRLATEAGHADRVERVLGDATAPPADLPDADVALLYRTVCCTIDWQAMLDTAIDRNPRVLAFTFPKRGLVPTVVGAVGNTFLRLVRDPFRMRHHDPDAMLAHVGAAGYEVVHDRARVFWRTVVLAR